LFLLNYHLVLTDINVKFNLAGTCYAGTIILELLQSNEKKKKKRISFQK